MFSIIIINNKEYQFKTGGDSCDTYSLGDEAPGDPRCRDGAYRVHDDTYWVIIKNHKIAAAVPLVMGDGGSNYRDIIEKYGLLNNSTPSGVC